jgi:hypothetical protein
MIEPKAAASSTIVGAIELEPAIKHNWLGAVADARPPQARIVRSAEVESYARKANRVTIRHPDGAVVAVVGIVSPGNKDSRHAVHAFAAKAAEFLLAGIHLLIVDLFPPGPRDPQGIHKVIWDVLHEEPFELPPDKPLTMAAYEVGAEFTAYIEPVAVGDVLPDMPIFLKPGQHVPCPLEVTYRTAWEQFPIPLRTPLEAPSEI